MNIPSQTKTFFVTGCASGIGAYLVTYFLEQGHQVFATDIDIVKLRALKKSENWPQDRVYCQKLDVTRLEDWQSAYLQLDEAFGGVDVHLNVAGYLLPRYITETDEDMIDRHLSVNIKGVIYGSKAAANYWLQKKQKGGHIINIASLAGVAAIPGIALYSTSKFAVRGFSLALRAELKSHDIAVTVVGPDAVKTPMLDLQKDYKEAALTFSGTRYLKVEEIAKVIDKKVLTKRPAEVNIPKYRGALAKISSMFPSTVEVIEPILRRKGLKAQKSYKL